MTKKHKFKENVEKKLVSLIIDNEYRTAQTNQEPELADFESYIDLFDAERTEKDYDWMSDIFIPEFPSHMLTQSSIDVSQYFATRDFVEVYIESEKPEDIAAAESTKELINRTLNRRNLYHYPKFVRGKNINHLVGHVDLHCWWEQEIDYEYDEDEFGLADEREVVVKDQFNYEVLDPRNVFTDTKYCYSMQERDWVIIRSERILEQLKKEAEQFGYFNLDLLEDGQSSETYKTETHKDTIDSDTGGKEHPADKTSPRFDILKRLGKHWIMPDGKPGVDENGEVKPKATFEELVITFAVAGGTKTLIGFHKTPYKDAYGNPYKTVIRGLCYIHPTRDAGVGDGKYASELQVAINDTFNVSNDRVMLATMPTLKGKKYVTEDTDTIYFQPGHLMDLENPSDVEEFQISDNISGAMQQIGLLTNKMQQADAIFPSTMGDLPQAASTTATAVAGAEQRSNQRSQYKSMTFEYTALMELYWMIQQMTFQFAKEKTGFKLMGDKVYDFNPTLNYTFKPLSQSIETDSSKQMKINSWTQLFGMIAPLGTPMIPAMNYIIGEIAKLKGDEYVNFAQVFITPGTPMGDQQPQQPGEGIGGGASNQFNISQSPTEIGAREVASF